MLHTLEERRIPGARDDLHVRPPLLTSKEKTVQALFPRSTSFDPSTVPLRPRESVHVEEETESAHERVITGKTTWQCFCLWRPAELSLWLSHAVALAPLYQHSDMEDNQSSCPLLSLYLEPVPESGGTGFQNYTTPGLKGLSLEVICSLLFQAQAQESTPEPQSKAGCAGDSEKISNTF